MRPSRRLVERGGPLGAIALIAAVGEAHGCKSGPQMAAWLGFVPRRCSTGAKTRLLGMSRRGNRYLRTLLIHRARAVLRHATQRPDAGSRWLIALMRRRGRNVAVVALTNKHARILWAFMTRVEAYRKAVCVRDGHAKGGGGPAPHVPGGTPTLNGHPADAGDEGFTLMARQVRAALSQPGPNTGPRGPISGEAKERACHQGHRSKASGQEVGDTWAVVTLPCQQPRNPLANGVGPYVCGADTCRLRLQVEITSGHPTGC